MNVLLINGSPRTRQYSNTDKILQPFMRGLEAEGNTYDHYTLSSRKEWDAAREAYLMHQKIIFALPMYVESIPSLMLEFLDTLPTERTLPAELSFIVHGGFDEGYQFRLCERLLMSICVQLGCSYGGCLIKGGSFMYRLFKREQVEKMTQAYTSMAASYCWNGNFLTPAAQKFTGPERYPWLVRQMVGLVLKFIANKKFDKFAAEWGCTTPLDVKNY